MGVDGRLFAPALHPAPPCPAKTRPSSTSGEAMPARRSSTSSTSSSPNVARSTFVAQASTWPPMCWSDSSAPASVCADVHVPRLAVWSRPSHAALRRLPASSCSTRSRCCRTTSWTAHPAQGKPSAHVQFADWHRDRGCPARRQPSVSRLRSCSATCAWSGPSRCCATAASTTTRRTGHGRDTTRCAANWPSVIADLVNDVGGLPTLDEVLEVARRSRALHGAPPAGDRRGDGGLRRPPADPARRLRRRGG